MTERTVDNMDVGFYKLSMAKNAPDVGAIIFMPCPMDPFYGFPMDRPRHLCAQINGEDVPLWRIGQRAAERITKAEYEFLIADRAWAREFDPQSPEATPSRAVGIRDIPVDSLRP